MNYDNGDGSGIRRLSEDERLRLMADDEHAECEALERMVPLAIAQRYETDRARWPSQSVLAVLAQFEATGASGFTVVRSESGLVFSPCGVPAYLKEAV